MADQASITIRVIPRSSRSEIVGFEGDLLKVRLTSPPVDGAANTELVKLLSKKLHIAKSAITIVSGETARTKRLRIEGVSNDQLRRQLMAIDNG